MSAARRPFLPRKPITAAMAFFCLCRGPWLLQASKLQAATSLRLDLETAENMAVAHDPALKASVLDLNIINIRKQSHTNTILPELTWQASVQTQAGFDRPQDTSSINLSERIPNPWLWSLEKSSLEYQSALANLQTDFTRQALLTQVRQQYFSLQYCLRRQAIAGQALQLFEEFKTLSEKRYQNGYINQSDLLRTQIQYEEQKVELIDTKAFCEVEQSKFLSLLGLDPAQTSSLTLTTPLAIKMQSLYLQVDKLKTLQSAQEPFALKQEKLQVADADAEARKAYHETWIPQISIGVSYPTNRYDEPAPTYTASLNWNIFSGGIDYYSYKSKVYEKSKKNYELVKAEQDYWQKTNSLIAELASLKEKWSYQEKIVNSWEQMADQSRQRFKQGLISSKDVSDDLTSLLQQRQKQLEVMHEVIEKMINLSFEMKRPELLKLALK